MVVGLAPVSHHGEHVLVAEVDDERERVPARKKRVRAGVELMKQFGPKFTDKTYKR
jgi:hypothetical protein